MAHDEPAASGAPTKLAIKNVGLMLSGDLEKPILDADAIVAVNGRITAIGRAADLDLSGATTTIDAHGVAIAPGLIDSHVHPVAGDWTPRQSQLNWIDSCLHGGVTTMVSAGEVHTPGRPRDIVGLKAMAITAQRCFSNFRASGVKVHAGAPVIEPGMEEHDFEELASAGVRFLGEVGLGGVKDGPTARKMVAWARKYGINSTIHTGGPSIPGSGLIDKDIVLEADTDVIGHINGGHTALPDDQIVCLCEGCKRGLELVHNGNERAALFTLRTAKERGELNRVILGTDAPAGSGVQPLGILRMVDAARFARRGSRGGRLLLCDRQHGAHAGARLRAYRGRTRCRFRLHGSRAAFGGQDAARERAARRPAWGRHDRHRRNCALASQPQHAAR